jgi:hypothetical protein
VTTEEKMSERVRQIMEKRSWYEADALMADLTVYFHRLRATSEEEIEERMRKRYPRAAAILVRRKDPSELPGYRKYEIALRGEISNTKGRGCRRPSTGGDGHGQRRAQSALLFSWSLSALCCCWPVAATTPVPGERAQPVSVWEISTSRDTAPLSSPVLVCILVPG